MNLLITICARGGSKSIPKKNIKELNGIPLIGYSIECAKKFGSQFNTIIEISSDSKEIIEACSKFGINTKYVRPSELATDTAGKLAVIYDVYNYAKEEYELDFDYVLDLDVSSPLRTYEDLNKAFEIMENDKNALNLFSVNKANRNPYFNMVEKTDNGYYDVSKDVGYIKSRQTAPEVYDLNASFYFYKRKFFVENYHTIYSGKAMIYEMPHLCFDLDEPIDFVFMEYLLSNNILDFKI